MAGRTLVLACLLSAIAIAYAQSGEAGLRKAILDRRTTKYTIREDITLKADLPALPSGKKFTLVGALKGGKGKVTINGAKKFAIFRDSAGPATLELKNLIIVGSKANTAAVALSAEGSSVSISDVDFVRNWQGVLVSFTGKASEVSKSTFTGNENSAIVVSGAEDPDTTVDITSSTFTSNKAPVGGGAVDVRRGGNVKITSSKFFSNSAPVGGAVRFLRDGVGTITSSEFIGNTAKEAAGALSAFNAFVTITGSTFKDNVAQTGPGGALRVASSSGFGSVVNVTRSTFSGNKAPASSGGAFVTEANADLTILSLCRTTFTSNTAKSKGANNGFVIGSRTQIETQKAESIRSVARASGAALAYVAVKDCK